MLTGIANIKTDKIIFCVQINFHNFSFSTVCYKLRFYCQYLTFFMFEKYWSHTAFSIPLKLYFHAKYIQNVIVTILLVGEPAHTLIKFTLILDEMSRSTQINSIYIEKCDLIYEMKPLFFRKLFCLQCVPYIYLYIIRSIFTMFLLVELYFFYLYWNITKKF